MSIQLKTTFICKRLILNIYRDYELHNFEVLFWRYELHNFEVLFWRQLIFVLWGLIKECLLGYVPVNF